MAELDVRQEGGVTVLSMDTDPLNTMTLDWLVQLRSFLTGIQEAFRSGDYSSRALIIESKRDHVFSFGINPEELLERDLDGRFEVFRELFAVLGSYADLEIPTAVCLNGPALAGGAVLACMSEAAFVSMDAAKLCFSEVKVGIPVPAAIFKLAERRVGPSVLMDMMVFGKNFTAPDLLQCGYSKGNYGSKDELQEMLELWAGKIHRLNPAILGRCLRTEKEDLKQALREGVPRLEEEFKPFLTDEYLGNGLRQMLAARKAK